MTAGHAPASDVIIAELPRAAANDRAVYIGPTGSGKTELARALEIQFDNLIVVDPKHRFSWNEASTRYSRTAYTLKELVTHLREIEEKRSGAPVIYRPPSDHLLPKNIAQLDEVYRIAYERGSTRVYNDDFGACCQFGASNVGNYLPNWFKCATLGRQRFVGLGASIQRPANVPLVSMSESDYRVTFYLRMRNDQRRAEELCGPIDWRFLAQNEFSFVWATDKFCSTPMRLRLGATLPPLEATA
jgi:hypothetical protein